ncbi:hypothetical protein [Shewanella sp. NIFS-20-20]|uniref:hypothetical protein n=1 Tax=Shewanella sp. NIFS-20-20 TaxID=2853806 RepID=UPI001C493E84|nr:hypothetical protein [Shewanella sp. NIFS-20-20]MBV7314958.1 hypothetical protein [Shewanella sp. NIFS-20-20]
MKHPNIEQVLTYQNQNVIDRFIKLYNVEQTEAEQLFDDVKRWLWLASKTDSLGINKPLVIDSALVVIDEMWHNFMLFTREYCAFCNEYFGKYLHHAPFAQVNARQQQKIATDGSDNKQALIAKKRWQYELVFDHLGKDTFIRWFQRYPQQYTSLSLAQRALTAENQRTQALKIEIEKRKTSMAGAA